MENSINWKQIQKNYQTIDGGFFGKYDDFKLKKANEIIQGGFEVLPIVPNTNGEICNLYQNYQKDPNMASINNKWDLERFLCDMNRNVGYENDGWRYEYVVLDNMDHYQKVVEVKYKINGGQSGSL